MQAHNKVIGVSKGDAATQEACASATNQGSAVSSADDSATVATPPGDFSFLDAPKEAGELGWFGNYRVLEWLGQGGMGVVFRAEAPRLQRPVALKVMLPDIAQGDIARQRFLREARAT